jgi:hypothetical protein
VEPAPADGFSSAGLSCPYCRVAIPPEQFIKWPLQPRLATSKCSACGRSVTVPIQWVSDSQRPTDLDDTDTDSETANTA